MAENSSNTGDAGALRVYAAEVWYNAAENWSDVYWELWLMERYEYNYSYGYGIGASIDIYTPGGSWVLWAGGFDFDWRGGGIQNTLIASGTQRVYHYSDGSGAVGFVGHMGNTGTSGAGGPASVNLDVGLTFLQVAPNTPASLTATRVSDTQINLSWVNSGASNGQPQTNDIITRVNNGAWGPQLTIGAQNGASVGAAANQKLEYQVRAWNGGGGHSGWAGPTSPVYTTPGAPTGVTATKGTDLNITVGFTSGVAYSEHEHEVWHGTITGGVTTWDGSALTTLPSGTLSYVHTAPDPSKVHVYRVRAKAAGLYSSYGVSNSVQLLAAPNKPTIGTLPQYADKASDLAVPWVHNAIDTTPQTAYEFSYSTNGGSTWSTTGKVTSAVSSRTVAGGSYPANTALTIRVRTWGSATSGGSDGTGASPWSDQKTVTFKTVPVATVTTPAEDAVINEAVLRVTLGFSQAEAATFVSAQVQLMQGATVLEDRTSSILVGITFTTPVLNGQSYTIRARVRDSNGLWSAWVTSDFSVEYLPPVVATATVQYLPDTGFGQVNVTLPEPGEDEAAAETVTITRTIGGVTETIVKDYPSAASLVFLDTTPTVHGTNTYTIVTTSALGAQSSMTIDLVTTECRRAFLSKGAQFQNVGVFGANLSVKEALSVASTTVETAGRLRPIGMYGTEGSVVLTVSSFVFENFGSTMDELRAILLMPGKACFRDSSGRRVFGTAKGGIAYKKTTRGDLNFTMTETS